MNLPSCKVMTLCQDEKAEAMPLVTSTLNSYSVNGFNPALVKLVAAGESPDTNQVSIPMSHSMRHTHELVVKQI